MRKNVAFWIMLTLWCGISSQVFAQGSAFTYQGRLVVGAGPADGSYDFTFSLYDNVTSGSIVGLSLTNASTSVADGLFMVTLDFGTAVFNGGSRWLEVGVRTNGSTLAYTTLTPRQAVTPAPYATLAAAVPDGSITSAKIAPGAINGSVLGPMSALGTPDGSRPDAIRVSNYGDLIGGGPFPLWFDIFNDTHLGDDSGALRLGGGGDVLSTRGATIELYGNQRPGGVAGKLRLYAGDGSDIDLVNGNVLVDRNLGIGTSNPHNALEVVGSTSQTVRLTAPSAGAGTAVIFADTGPPSRPNWLVGAQYNVNAGFEITPSSDLDGTVFTNPGVILRSNGDMGIGRMPSHRLDVAGAVAVNGTPVIDTNGNWIGPVSPPSGTAGGALAGSFPNPKIAAGAVGTVALADGSVTGGKIAPATIDITKLTFTPVTSESDPKVGANIPNYVPKWNGSALVAGTVYDNGNIGIGTITPGQKLSVAGTVESTSGGFKFPDGTVLATATFGGDLQGLLPNPTIAPGVVGTSKLADLGVTEAKLAASSVSSGKLAPGAVGASTLADGAVTSSKLADGAVTFDKLAPGAGEMRGTFDVTHYGAVADGTADDSPAIQRAINDASLKGGVVWLPPGTYRLGSGLVISKQIILGGGGWSLSGPGGNGSWLYIKDTTVTAITIQSSAAGTVIRDLAFTYAQPLPAPGWAPSTYPPAIQASATDAYLYNLFLRNPTRGINVTSSGAAVGRITLDRIWGQPLLEGIVIDNALDVVKVSNIHFWPFWAPTSADVSNYMIANAIGIHSYRNDNPHFTRLFALGYNTGMLFDESKGGSKTGITSKFRLSDADFDGCSYGIRVTGANTTGQIVNFTTQGNNGGGVVGIQVSADNVTIQACNVRVSVEQANGIRAQGTNTRLFLQNSWVEGWNLSGKGFPGIEAVSPAEINIGFGSLFLNGNGAPDTGGTGTINLGN